MSDSNDELEALFGDAYRAVRSDPAAQEQLLEATNPLARLLGLCILRTRQVIQETLLQQIETIAMGGVPNPLGDEREIAWLLLSKSYEATHCDRICRLAASCVMNEAEIDTVRLSAYCALLYVTDQFADSNKAVSQLTFPLDVDWEIVRRYQ
jgi:hypothetical protein